MYEDVLVFNIETIARPDLPLELLPRIEDIDVPATYKNPEAIQGYRERKLAEMVDKLPLSPLTGKIICMGLASSSIGGTVVKLSNDEAELIAMFNDAFETIFNAGHSPKLVGFNSIGFDLPYLLVSAMRNKMDLATGVETSRYLNRYGDYHIDLYDKLTGGKRGHGTLKEWAFMLGVKPIFGDGSMIGQWFKNAEFENIKQHCLTNVEASQSILNRYMSTIYGFQDPDAEVRGDATKDESTATSS